MPILLPSTALEGNDKLIDIQRKILQRLNGMLGTSSGIENLSGYTTDNLTEGISNLYWTLARFNSSLAAKTTSDLVEGSNQYFTNARARLALSAGTGISYDSSTGSISSTIMATPGGSNTQLQFNDGGAFAGSSSLTWDKTVNKLKLISLTSQAGNVLDIVRQSDGESLLYVNQLGNLHVGAKDPYVVGSFTYRDSQRLYLDYYFNGTRQDVYMQAVPNSPGSQNQAKLQFIVSGTLEMEISGVSGPSFPTGSTSGVWVTSGSTIRTSNTSAGTIRGEFNTITLQGETNTAGQYDIKILGKNPFGGATASNICGFFSDTTAMAVVTKEGYLSLAQASLRFLGRTSTAADPTTTELPSDKDFAIHKNSTTSIVYLAYNDGGTIKKVALA